MYCQEHGYVENIWKLIRIVTVAEICNRTGSSTIHSNREKTRTQTHTHAKCSNDLFTPFLFHCRQTKWNEFTCFTHKRATQHITYKFQWDIDTMLTENRIISSSFFEKQLNFWTPPNRISSEIWRNAETISEFSSCKMNKMYYAVWVFLSPNFGRKMFKLQLRKRQMNFSTFLHISMMAYEHRRQREKLKLDFFYSYDRN